MNTQSKAVILGLGLVVSLALPQLSSAAINSGDACSGIPCWGPVITCTGNYLDENSAVQPCTNICDVVYTVRNIIYIVLTFLLLGAAPALFLAGGVMVLIAGANPGLLEKGKKTLWAAAVGVALALGSYVIIATLFWALQPRVSSTGQGGIAWPDITCDPANLPGAVINPDVFKQSNPQ